MTTYVPAAQPWDPGLMEQATDLVRGGQICALTGAGMSTGSGIPDYRGPDGRRRVSPMTFSEFLRSSESRDRYWSRASIGWVRFAAARPNAAHAALAELQGRGFVTALITQNVDGLHQEAGSPEPVELHGSLARVICLDCGALWDRELVQAIVERDNPGHLAAGVAAPLRPDGDVELDPDLARRFTAPRCPACGGDRLKPDVVFFGESVPKERVERCAGLVESARGLLVVGSSVAVMSSFRFVRLALARSVPVVIVTRGWTRADDLDVLKIDALAAPVLQEMLRRLPSRP